MVIRIQRFVCQMRICAACKYVDIGRASARFVLSLVERRAEVAEEALKTIDEKMEKC